MFNTNTQANKKVLKKVFREQEKLIEQLKIKGNDHIEILQRYIDDSDDLNQSLLRNKNTSSSGLSEGKKDYKRQLDNVFKSIKNKIDEPFFVYRGIKNIPLCQKIVSRNFDFFYHPQFMSTTYEPNVATSFARISGSPGCIFRIHIFPDDDIKYIHISPLTDSREEHEILFQRKLFLIPLKEDEIQKTSSSNTNTNHRYIDVKVSKTAPLKSLNLNAHSYSDNTGPYELDEGKLKTEINDIIKVILELGDEIKINDIIDDLVKIPSNHMNLRLIKEDDRVKKIIEQQLLKYKIENRSSKSSKSR